ncbi:outer membrane beta-barrel protein [Emticicia sp. BO119]|uniref:outer membrane beta-barrel protein n=1 Tax=Emticicia sp. BO119 TaxID=2757768 RepID=UPI0015F09202|nr:outer membrane beta-barrel protein [Emticicia sp. BO119]
MKSELNFILLLLLIANPGLAQKNFTKGKIITFNKDTLSGYINYKEWIKSPNQISFKDDPTQSARSYTTSQIAGFSIDSNKETYHALNFDIENLPRSSNKIVYFNMKEYSNRTKKIESVSAFVRIVSDGNVTLYHYVDKDSEPHFLLKKADSLIVLVYHIVETKHYSAKFREYRSQLSKLLTESCKPLSIHHTEYYVSSMRKLIDNYNECFNSAIKSIAPQKDKGRWEYGIIAGVGYTKMTHAMANPFRYIEVKGNANITPVGGLFLNYVFARGRGKYALLNELHTYQTRSSVTYDDEHFHYQMHYLGLQHLFRYTFFVGKPSVYALIGFSYATIIKQNSTITRRDGSVEKLVYLPWAVRNDEQRAIAGIGLSHKRLMIETRYYRGNGFTTGANATPPNNRLDLLLKYNFGRIN